MRLSRKRYNYSDPADDADVLSQKLQRLVQDVALRKRLGRAAKQKVESQFSPDRETEIWRDIYYRVSNKSSAPLGSSSEQPMTVHCSAN